MQSYFVHPFRPVASFLHRGIGTNVLYVKTVHACLCLLEQVFKQGIIQRFRVDAIVDIDADLPGRLCVAPIFRILPGQQGDQLRPVRVLFNQ